MEMTLAEFTIVYIKVILKMVYMQLPALFILGLIVISLILRTGNKRIIFDIFDTILGGDE